MQLNFNDGFADWVAQFDTDRREITSLQLEHPADVEVSGNVWNDFTELDKLHYNKIVWKEFDL